MKFYNKLKKLASLKNFLNYNDNLGIFTSVILIFSFVSSLGNNVAILKYSCEKHNRIMNFTMFYKNYVSFWDFMYQKNTGGGVNE